MNLSLPSSSPPSWRGVGKSPPLPSAPPRAPSPSPARHALTLRGELPGRTRNCERACACIARAAPLEHGPALRLHSAAAGSRHLGQLVDQGRPWRVYFCVCLRADARVHLHGAGHPPGGWRPPYAPTPRPRGRGTWASSLPMDNSLSHVRSCCLRALLSRRTARRPIFRARVAGVALAGRVLWRRCVARWL